MTNLHPLPTLTTASLGELASLACQQQQQLQQQQQQQSHLVMSTSTTNKDTAATPLLLLPGINSLISPILPQAAKEPATPTTASASSSSSSPASSSSLAASPSKLAFSPLLPLAAAGSPASPQSQAAPLTSALPLTSAPAIAVPASTSPTFSALPTLPAIPVASASASSSVPAFTPSLPSLFQPQQPQQPQPQQPQASHLFTNPAAIMQYYSMAYYQLLQANLAAAALQPQGDLPSPTAAPVASIPTQPRRNSAHGAPLSPPLSDSSSDAPAAKAPSDSAPAPAPAPVPAPKKTKRPTPEQLQQPSKKARLDSQGQNFSHVPHKRAYKHNPPPTMTKCCTSCGSNTTPEWRSGPKGPKTLCNACGLQYSKAQRLNKKQDTTNQPQNQPEPQPQNKTNQQP